MQQKYMKEIWREFKDYIRAVCPMFDREPKGLEMIAKVAEHIFDKPWMGKESVEEIMGGE
ncbi:MAG: hypothetical protein ACTSXW_01835, partial [Candidatus Baldrarchaeia archaeon]